MKTKQKIIEEFNESLEYSIDKITYERLMLEILVDIRDAMVKVKEEQCSAKDN